MNAAIFIYLAEVLNNIGMILALTGICGLIVFAMYTGVHWSEEGNYHDKNWTWIAPCVCIVISCFVPSTKTIYMMAGAVLGEKALESNVGQQLQQIVELKLDEEIAKLKKETTK